MSNADIEVKDITDTDGETDPTAGAHLIAEKSGSNKRCVTPNSADDSPAGISNNGNHGKHRIPLLCSNKVRDSQSCGIKRSVSAISTTSTISSVISSDLCTNHSRSGTAESGRNTAGLHVVTVTIGDTAAEKTTFTHHIDGEIDKLKEAWQLSVKPTIKMVAVKSVISFVTGIVFGIAMQKGAVYEPRVIRAQFIYERFIMLKMFLAAVGFGALCLAMLSVLPFTKDAFERAFRSYVACLPRKGVLAVAGGGFMLGAGMTISGACPGMVLVQVGAWVGHGSCLMTLFGCLSAALVYGLIEPFLSKFLVPKKAYEKQAAIHWVNVPFTVLAIAMSVATATIVFTLEWFFPWQEELFVPNSSKASWFFELLAWPPFIAGILIGTLQIPVVLAIGDTLGGSSGYCTIVSQLLVTKYMESKAPYLANFKRGIGNWWQVFYVTGAVLGGLTSAIGSHSLGTVPGVSLQSSFIGGFLMIFGARLAGGCTSGHGLSGVGLLMILSMVAAATMFIGGTVVGFICLAMDKAGIIDYYTF